MDDFWTNEFCERCGEHLNGTRRMSRFNLDCLCQNCISAEEKHKDFDKATNFETRAVKSRVKNYPGIGLPKELLPQTNQYVVNKTDVYFSLGELRNALYKLRLSDEVITYLTDFTCESNKNYKDIEVSCLTTSDIAHSICYEVKFGIFNANGVPNKVTNIYIKSAKLLSREDVIRFCEGLVSDEEELYWMERINAERIMDTINLSSIIEYHEN